MIPLVAIKGAALLKSYWDRAYSLKNGEFVAQFDKTGPKGRALGKARRARAPSLSRAPGPGSSSLKVLVLSSFSFACLFEGISIE